MANKFSYPGEETTMEACAAPRARPRERIVETARDLFHKHGIKGVGVDAIAEAAGTNKMTLYRHFGSKDELIVQCLRECAIEADAWWTEIQSDESADPLARLRAWVAFSAECVVDDDRGCDVANAAVELAEAGHPARRVIEEIKTRHRDRLARLCAEAGIARADLLADTLWLLLEGARVSRQSVGVTGPSAKFVTMSEVIIAAFLAPR